MPKGQRNQVRMCDVRWKNLKFLHPHRVTTDKGSQVAGRRPFYYRQSWAQTGV